MTRHRAARTDDVWDRPFSVGNARWRTWLRVHTPDILYHRLGLIVPLARDCGDHEWHNAGDGIEACYHCRETRIRVPRRSRSMMPDIDIVASVEVALDSTDEGGRRTPIFSGYRPLCRFDDDVMVRSIGMCELEAVAPLVPGATGKARLVFSSAVSSTVRELLAVGATITLFEGDHRIGSAVVVAVKHDQG